MQQMQQGEEYLEEDGEYDEELDGEFDEGDENTDAQIETLWNIPKKYIYIGGAVLLVLIGLLVVVKTRKTSSDNVVPALSDEELTTLYDDSDVYYEEEEYEPSPEELGYVWDNDTGTWLSPEEVLANQTVDSASSEDQIILRRMGYTGDEINWCLSNGFSIDDMVAAAQEKYDQEASDALVRMSDSASDEFRYIVDMTYFGQPGSVFESQKDLDVTEKQWDSGMYRVNADYIKCPTYGTQLQLKCKVSEDEYVWYSVTPQRWDELPAKGNIVLQIDWTTYHNQYWITAVAETDKTLDTIDASTLTGLEDIVEQQNLINQQHLENARAINEAAREAEEAEEAEGEIEEVNMEE